MGDPASSWLTVEVDRSVLESNIATFRRHVGRKTRLLAVVKANAYGHGLLIAADAFLAGGADVLGVHSVAEAIALREGGVTSSILVLGPVSANEAVQAAERDVEITVASCGAVEQAAACGKDLTVHLKVETGVNRQGVTESELPEVLSLFQAHRSLKLVGVSSHFADIEDTTDHAFATEQMERFGEHVRILAEAGYGSLVEHMSCSAAVLLWDRTHRSLARVGISAYGIWPSRETLVSVRQRGRQELDLRPAMTWKVRISQIRDVPAGQTVGYGRTWKAPTDCRVAILPVGYSDGYPRALGGRAHVLVQGRRAPVIGRVCMNLCMVDVTHVPEAREGDQAVLLGRQGDEIITCEMLAGHLGTIAYEVLTLPGPSWKHVAV